MTQISTYLLVMLGGALAANLHCRERGVFSLVVFIITLIFATNMAISDRGDVKSTSQRSTEKFACGSCG